jgi:hypothetical protein
MKRGLCDEFTCEAGTTYSSDCWCMEPRSICRWFLRKELGAGTPREFHALYMHLFAMIWTRWDEICRGGSTYLTTVYTLH